MTLFSIVFGIFSLNVVQSHESSSSEANRIEVSPFYDAMIFGDIAEIINEFENNMKTPLEALTSGSESEENLDDLLSEYQQYLDKAYKQRTDYIEKVKPKNKVPFVRHERYSKNNKPGVGVKSDDFYYSNEYNNPYKFVQTSFNNPIDLFVPKYKYATKQELTTARPKEVRNEYGAFSKGLIELPPVFPKPDVGCKHCSIPLESMALPLSFNNHKLISERGLPLLQNSEYVATDRRDMIDNNMNIKIKVEIQMPNMQDILGKQLKNRSRESEVNSKESLSTLNMPSPLFNFRIPMDLFGHKRAAKFNRHESPLRRIIIHRKKKSKFGNSNKKHRKKGMSWKVQPNYEENSNFTDDYQNVGNSNETIVKKTFVTDTQKGDANINNTFNNKTEPLSINETHTEESIFVMLNISNNNDNGTDENHKNENSVESDYSKSDVNSLTEKPLVARQKRETVTSKNETSSKSVINTSIKPEYTSQKPKISSQTPEIATVIILTKYTTEKILQEKSNDYKKNDKGVLADAELLYWPNSAKNLTVVTSKNITTIILERENQKGKLVMTKESIHNNKTRALEKAIFGEANWDDVDTVAPVFLSFIGKYINGALTFCSQNVCHSMQCAEKSCVYRICRPEERWNQRGHCSGLNTTDSIASLESIMDLPSKVAFEIVDILQDKMLGKMYGKVTLCISSKCISFVASKKSFVKAKCLIKELNSAHCPNVKSLKSMYS